MESTELIIPPTEDEILVKYKPSTAAPRPEDEVSLLSSAQSCGAVKLLGLLGHGQSCVNPPNTEIS